MGGVLDTLSGRFIGQILGSRYMKPAYECRAEGKIVVVPGSAAIPSIVYIGGEVRAATVDKFCSVAQTGTNGLDIGTVAAGTAYYLYAVPGDAGTFDLVISAQPPANGPVGYEKWSYVGGLCTIQGGTTIPIFKASGGLLIGNNEIESESHTGGVVPNGEIFGCLPVTAQLAWGSVSILGGTTDSLGRVMGTNTTDANAVFQNNVVAGSVQNYAPGFVPIFTAQTIYLQLDTAGNTVDFLLLGWREDPSLYP